MICQLCGKRSANVCINIDINGLRSRRFICDKCADERKLRENPSGEIILALVKDIKEANGGREPEYDDSEMQTERTCDSCGMGYGEFAKTLLLGCADCYENFKDLLAPVMERITKPTADVAAVDEAQNTTQKSRKEILKLRLQMKKCVEDEDYEGAAQLRDRIAELEEREHGVKADG